MVNGLQPGKNENLCSNTRKHSHWERRQHFPTHQVRISRLPISIIGWWLIKKTLTPHKQNWPFLLLLPYSSSSSSPNSLCHQKNELYHHHYHCRSLSFTHHIHSTLTSSSHWPSLSLPCNERRWTTVEKTSEIT